MIEEELIKKVKSYLDENNIFPVKGSLEYNGIRKDVPQLDGSIKTMKVVEYRLQVNQNKYESEQFYYVYIDALTNVLCYILGPQSYIRIED